MTACVDWRKALENADGSEELLMELIEVFNEEYPDMMRQVRAAIDAGDAVALRRTAHNLKGSARIFGAEPTTEVAQRLETMGADGDLGGAEACWSELSLEVDLLAAALAERIRRRDS